MKLIKIKDNTLTAYFYVIETIDCFGVYKRTIREFSIMECIRDINIDSKDLNSDKFVKCIGEEIIYELEFNKPEDLLELVPEEFL